MILSLDQYCLETAYLFRLLELNTRRIIGYGIKFKMLRHECCVLSCLSSSTILHSVLVTIPASESKVSVKEDVLDTPFLLR